jgi:Mg2+ and Co2+ transporter CorA
MNVIMAVVGTGTLVTSMFGMNIISGLEYYNKPYFFWALSLMIVLSLIIMSYAVLRYFGVFHLLPFKSTKQHRQ